jgi:hypothetical protein
LRAVEIRRLDAVRLYGSDAMWKDVGRRPAATYSIANSACEG